MRNKAVVLICTRTESSRLPGKALKKIAGVPAIEHILWRLSGSRIPVVLAVPNGCRDFDHLVSDQTGVYYGDPDSPLHRMANYAASSDADWIIRITHDDILIDQKTMLDLMERCIHTPGCGYGSSPRIVEGAGVEIIHRDNLIKAAEDRTEPTEFVSYFVKSGPRPVQVNMEPRSAVKRPYRLTMDYPEDALILDMLLKGQPFMRLDDLVAFIDLHPHVLNVNRQPLVTFYTCAYNTERYVQETCRSIFAPGFDDFEYIFIDDHSTDRTLLKASEFSSDRRLRLVRNEENIGLSSSCNVALGLARGRYIMRVDSDDWIIKSQIHKLIDELDSGAAAVYPSFYRTDETGTVSSFCDTPHLYHHAAGALMEKRMLNELRFKDGLRHWDSLDLYNRIKGRFDIRYTKEPFFYYRQRAGSLSSTTTEERENDRKRIAS